MQPGAADFDAAKAAAVDAAVRLLHLVAGVSYYKAAAPSVVECADGPLDAATAAFIASVYENGLGEFAYRNGLDLRGHLRWPTGGTARPVAPALGLEAPGAFGRRALVAIGGGKDSLVSIEALRAAGKPSVPSLLGEEQAANPFLRADAPELAAAIGMAGRDPVDVFAEVRRRKDVF